MQHICFHALSVRTGKNDLYGGHYILTYVFFACNDQLFVHSAVDIVWSVHFIKVHLSFSEASRHVIACRLSW